LTKKNLGDQCCDKLKHCSKTELRKTFLKTTCKQYQRSNVRVFPDFVPVLNNGAAAVRPVENGPGLDSTTLYKALKKLAPYAPRLTFIRLRALQATVF
jgi:hypothetical protein